MILENWLKEYEKELIDKAIVVADNIVCYLKLISGVELNDRN